MSVPPPGQLRHIDIKRLGRIQGVRHRIISKRQHQRCAIGGNAVHLAIGDHSRVCFANDQARREQARAALLRRPVGGGVSLPHSRPTNMAYTWTGTGFNGGSVAATRQPAGGVFPGNLTLQRFDIQLKTERRGRYELPPRRQLDPPACSCQPSHLSRAPRMNGEPR